MRDLAITLFLFGSVPFILWRPTIGVFLWVWVSVMNPHRLTWDFAYDLRFAQVIAIATLVGMLFSRQPKRRIGAPGPVFMLPSREEPFGIVLLEAGAMKVPVIASRIGGIPEIIVDSESGLLVLPEDAASLSEKIVELIENPGRRKSLAASLNKRVIECFT